MPAAVLLYCYSVHGRHFNYAIRAHLESAVMFFPNEYNGPVLQRTHIPIIKYVTEFRQQPYFTSIIKSAINRNCRFVHLNKSAKTILRREINKRDKCFRINTQRTLYLLTQLFICEQQVEVFNTFYNNQPVRQRVSEYINKQKQNITAKEFFPSCMFFYGWSRFITNILNILRS